MKLYEYGKWTVVVYIDGSVNFLKGFVEYVDNKSINSEMYSYYFVDNGKVQIIK